MTKIQLATLKRLMETDNADAVVDRLQDLGLCSCNCVKAEDVASVDAKSAIEKMRGQISP